MRKTLIFLSFLFCVTPIKADEVKKKETQIIRFKDFQTHSYFHGGVSTSCKAYLSKMISNNQKITLIDSAREYLYQNHSNPEVAEKQLFDFYKNSSSKNCFPELND